MNDQLEVTQINTLQTHQVNAAERAQEAEARAMVEARCLLAMKLPRNLHQTRAVILEACKRTTFAEQALYRKPVGKKEVNGQWVQNYAEGPSIRFAEEAVRAMKNTLSEVKVVFENDDKRVVQFALMDLESNNTDSSIIVVPKTVERSKPKDGQTVLSQRMNSNGKVVYLVQATDDDLQAKQAAMVAKARRDAIMRLFPSDIKEDAIQQIKKTLDSRDSADPKAALKRVLDAFQEQNIMPDQIEKYLGHEISTVTPAELQSLRGVYTAVREGDASWSEVLRAVEEDRESAMKASAAKASEKQSKKPAAASQDSAAMPSSDAAQGGNPKTNLEQASPAERAKAQASKTGDAIQKAGARGTLDIPME